MSKRKRVCIRRTLFLAVLLLGSVSAWRAGWQIIWNAIHGWDALPQLVVTLAFAGCMATLASWLEGKELKSCDVVRENQSL